MRARDGAGCCWRVLWRRDSAGVDLVAVGSDEIDAQDSLVLERLQKLGVRHAATLRRPHNLQRVLRDVILTSRRRHPVEILPSVVVAAKANACGSQRALIQICSRGQRDAQRDGARSGDCSAESVGSADLDLHIYINIYDGSGRRDMRCWRRALCFLGGYSLEVLEVDILWPRWVGGLV